MQRNICALTAKAFLTAIMEESSTADVQENLIQQLSPELLRTLLIDHSTSTAEKRQNIFWATSDYEQCGDGFGYHDPITPECITGKNGRIIMPRVLKAKDTQQERSHSMAEVFTPSWVCNAQNNLIDNEWFGRTDVFNREYTLEDGQHVWETNTDNIVFPEGKTWMDYVRDTRLEITCGEAPYIVSRYDTTTGREIPLRQRIGILDRKLRVVSENTSNSGEWLKAARAAYKSTYAYEWQGDNLLLAREAMLISFIEYYQDKFGKMPQLKSMKYIAYIISWNVWQMDGLKGVIPNSCGIRPSKPDLLGFTHELPCQGCKQGDIFKHNGIYCYIRDWRKKKAVRNIRFIDLLTQ